MIEIPVFLVNRSGNRASDNVHCSPCIDIVVVGPQSSVQAVAMLDTGATGIYGDQPILDGLMLPVLRPDTVFAVGRSHATDIYAAEFQINGLPSCQVEVQAVPIRSGGSPYDVILGRSFLTMFDFGFDRKANAWRLIY